MKAGDPPSEEDRLLSLRSYQILDSLPEEEYDHLTRIAAHICGTPVSLISLVDENRQWFKSRHGISPDLHETERDIAFCAYNIEDKEHPLIITDARQDARFADNPLVSGQPNVVFYAGVPLVNRKGYALGSLCVIDHIPRELDDAQLEALEALAGQVVKLFELRLALRQAEERLQERESAYALLRDFSHVIAHDLKAPIRNIRQGGEILLQEYGEQFSDEAAELLEMMHERTVAASDMVDGVLRYSKASHSLPTDRTEVSVEELVETAWMQVGAGDHCQMKVSGAVTRLTTSRVALLQIFQNLIGNAVKFCDKEQCTVTITSDVEDDVYRFRVADNGPGIPAAHRTAVFRLFHSADPGDRRGHGVGLSIVQRLVDALGGAISLESEVGAGTTFTFTLPRHQQPPALANTGPTAALV